TEAPDSAARRGASAGSVQHPSGGHGGGGSRVRKHDRRGLVAEAHGIAEKIEGPADGWPRGSEREAEMSCAAGAEDRAWQAREPELLQQRLGEALRGDIERFQQRGDPREGVERPARRGTEDPLNPVETRHQKIPAGPKLVPHL